MKRLNILYFFLLLVLCGFAFYALKSRTQIDIYANPTFKLSSYNFAYVAMRDVPSDCKYGDEEWVFRKIKENVWKMGYPSKEYSEGYTPELKNTDMLINCYIEKGLGKPRIGPHLYDIQIFYRKKVIIEFLDGLNKSLIAKASYNRGFSDPLEGDIEKIFNELKTKLKQAGSWSGNI